MEAKPLRLRSRESCFLCNLCDLFFVLIEEHLLALVPKREKIDSCLYKCKLKDII